MIPKIYQSNTGRSKNRVYYIMGIQHDHPYKAANSHFITSNCISTLQFGDLVKGTSKSADDVFNEIDTATKLRELEFGNRRVVKPVFHMSLSLAPGERLTQEQWTKAAEHMLVGLGFNLKTNKYYVALHTDTNNHHIHITANRIKLELGYNLAGNTQRENLKACELASEIEDMFGLVKAAKPTETWNTNMTRAEAYGSLVKDELSVKRKLLGIVSGTVEYVQEQNGDMFDLVRLLRKKNVYIHLTYNKGGKPTGIKYELDDKIIPGSLLKATRLTFSKLTQQEGIRYDETRLQELQVEIGKRHRGYKALSERDGYGQTKFRAIRGYYYITCVPESPRFNVFRLRVKARKAKNGTDKVMTHKEIMEIVEAIIKLIMALFGVNVGIKPGREKRGAITYYPDQPAEDIVAKVVPGYSEFMIEKMVALSKQMDVLADEGVIEPRKPFQPLKLEL
jgi:hypothetical protein